MSIKVLAYKVNHKPQVVELEETLEAWQKFVGGYIEIVPLKDHKYELVCNEEGLMMGLPFQAKYRLAGNFFIAKAGSDDLEGLNDEDIKYVTEKIQYLLTNVNRM